MCGGTWNEENRLPSKIVFGGEFLLETDDVAITLQNHQDVAEIATYLRQNDLQQIISGNFWHITDEEGFMYKSEAGFAHTLGWSEYIPAFYENAHNNNYQVIFTADF